MVAAIGAGRPPFRSPLDKRDEANAAKLRFAGGDNSDHLTMLRAYEEWEAAGGERGRRVFCDENFLAHQAMTMIQAQRRQYAKVGAM